MKNFKRTILVLALAIAMIFSATACGGTGDPVENLAGVTEDTIWVGNTAGTTGGLATIGAPFNLGIEAAFSVYNADGGYKGAQQVKLKHYDDGGVAASSKSLMQKLIHDDEVFAIVGNFGSDCIKANLKDIKDNKVPMVYAAAGNNELFNAEAKGADRYIFPVQPLNNTEGHMLILRAFAPMLDAEFNYIGGFAAQKVGVISNSNEASMAMVQGIKQEAEELPAEKQAAIIYQEVLNNDYSAAVSALKAANCDLVILTVIGDDFTSALLAMSNAEFATTVLTSYNNSNAAIFNDANSKLVPQYEGVFSTLKGLYAQGWLDISSTTYVYNENTPLNQVYAYLASLSGTEYTGTAGFNEAYWEVAENIYNYALTVDATTAFAMSYNSYALAGYIAGDLFCQGLDALEASGKDLTRANYVDVMEGVYKIAMAENISFAGGARKGVESFALSSILSYNGGAVAATVHGLTSIEDYRALIA